MNGGIPVGTIGNCGCKCTRGWTGKNCLKPSTCEAGANGQACFNGGYPEGTGSDCRCVCIDGFTGDNC